MSDHDGPHCQYTVLEGGIHRMVFILPDQRSVEECLQYLERALDAHDWKTRFLLLLDFRPGGLPPIIKGLTQGGRLLRQYDTTKLYAAYLINPNVLVTSLLGLLSTLNVQSRRRVFNSSADGAEQAAIAWLLGAENGEEGDAL